MTEINIEQRLTSAKLRVLFKQAVAGPIGDDVVKDISRLLFSMSEGGQEQANRAMDLFNDRLEGQRGDKQQVTAHSLLSLFCEGAIDLIGVDDDNDEFIWTPSVTITPEDHD